jgi:hypothetical protein
VTRCTYCLEERGAEEFGKQGEHVIPSTLGGGWIDSRVCASCNDLANRLADELISKDFLVRFLRAFYEIPDRYGRRPDPPVVTLPLNAGGVVKATLRADGPVFEAAVPPSVATELDLEDRWDQTRIREILREPLRALGDEQSLGLARVGQTAATPPEAWSRFMAKLGLACGRDAYGDAWLDSRQAVTLSRDLLGPGPLRLAQRSHHPPVSPTWPYLPPKHVLWIESRRDTAVLMVALFGQVLGAVPVNDLPATGDPSAWSFDPSEGSYFRSTYPAIWLASAARRINQAGGTPVLVGHPDYPFIFTPDGPDGPIDLGIKTFRAESAIDALRVAREIHERENDPPQPI